MLTLNHCCDSAATGCFMKQRCLNVSVTNPYTKQYSEPC